MLFCPVYYWRQRICRRHSIRKFCKSFQKKGRIRNAIPIKNFLFKVASNGALDYIKIQKRYRNHVGQWTTTVEHWEDDIHKKYIEAEAVAAVYREMNKLPPQVREVLRLSLFENESLNEIADEMKMQYKTVKNHKTKGMAMLRTYLLSNENLAPTVLVLALVLILMNNS